MWSVFGIDKAARVKSIDFDHHNVGHNGFSGVPRQFGQFRRTKDREYQTKFYNELFDVFVIPMKNLNYFPYNKLAKRSVIAIGYTSSYIMFHIMYYMSFSACRAMTSFAVLFSSEIVVFPPEMWIHLNLMGLKMFRSKWQSARAKWIIFRSILVFVDSSASFVHAFDLIEKQKSNKIQ